MSRILQISGLIVAVIVILVGGGLIWANAAVDAKLERSIDTHLVDFPIPFALTADEVAALQAERQAQGITDPLTEPALEAIALERATERGQHLVEARYACIECHGTDFGGGVMVDDPAIGQLLGPNITRGEGSVTIGYTPADWDRIVRHGLRRGGQPSAMPAEDFQLMSDRELSDIVAYLQSMPSVDKIVPPVSLGPLGTVLMATGELPLAADLIHDHFSAHLQLPPPPRVDAAFGKHLAGVCTGCHGPDLLGGPIPAGPPDWPAAANLSPHEDGLEGWSYEDFVTAMVDGVRPGGVELRMPMTLMKTYAANMTEIEMQALWAYLRSVEAGPGN